MHNDLIVAYHSCLVLNTLLLLKPWHALNTMTRGNYVSLLDMFFFFFSLHGKTPWEMCTVRLWNKRCPCSSVRSSSCRVCLERTMSMLAVMMDGPTAHFSESLEKDLSRTLRPNFLTRWSAVDLMQTIKLNSEPNSHKAAVISGVRAFAWLWQSATNKLESPQT